MPIFDDFILVSPQEARRLKACGYEVDMPIPAKEKWPGDSTHVWAWNAEQWRRAAERAGGSPFSRSPISIRRIS